VATHTGYESGLDGAAAVARTYLLAAENHIDRTIWYGADDRSWGGTWLENDDFRTLSTAGLGYVTVRALLVGKVPLGCSQESAAAHTPYICAFGAASGQKDLLAVWTTGAHSVFHAPNGTTDLVTVTGERRSVIPGSALAITDRPFYLTGSFGR
jgi:hypothetical protein